MAYRVIKKKINHDDTSPVTIHTTGTFTMVLWCVVNTVEAWTGAGALAKCNIGDAGTEDGLIALGQGQLTSVQKRGMDSSQRGAYLYDSTNEGVLHKGYSSATAITATFLPDGASQGECDVFIGLETLIDPP